MALTLNGSNQRAYRSYSRTLASATTLACRFKVPDPLLNSNDVIFGFYDDTQTSTFLRIVLKSANQAQGMVRTAAGAITAASTTTLTAGSWYSAVVTHDGAGNVAFFLDGETKKTGSGTPTGGVTLNTVVAGAGKSSSGFSEHWGGSLAYGGVWSRVLNDTECGDLANGTSKPTDITSGLVDAWDLIADGNTDASGTNLTLDNTPTFDAEDPLGGTTYENERHPPTAIDTNTNWANTLTAIDEDPDSSGTDWLASPDQNTNCDMKVSFATPSAALEPGADKQEFRVQAKQYRSASGTPSIRIELWENGSLVRAGTATDVTSTTEQVFSFTWNVSELTTSSGANVECKVFGIKSGGSPSARNAVDLGAIEWNASIESEGVTTYTKTTSLNAILKKQDILRTATLNAVLKKQDLTLSATLNSLLQKQGLTADSSLDALLKKTDSLTSDLDSILLKTGITKALTLDAVLQQQGLSLSSTIDALLKKNDVPITANIDAVLKKQGITLSTTFEALLQKTLTSSASLDAILVVISESTINTSLDAVLQKVINVTTSLDATLQKQGITTSTTLNSILQKTLSGSATVDALLQKNIDLSAVMNAILKKTIGQTATLDAVLVQVGTNTMSATIDSILRKTLSISTAVDAILQRQGLSFYSNLDALLKKQLSATATLDAILIAVGAVTVSIDSLLKKVGVTTSVSFDAVLITNDGDSGGGGARVVTRSSSRDSLIDTSKHIKRLHREDEEVLAVIMAAMEILQ